MNLVRFAYPKPDFGGHHEFFTSPEWDSRELFICFFQDRFLSRSAKKMTCRMDKCMYLVRFVYPKLDFGGHHECWYFHELEYSWGLLRCFSGPFFGLILKNSVLL